MNTVKIKNVIRKIIKEEFDSIRDNTLIKQDFDYSETINKLVRNLNDVNTGAYKIKDIEVITEITDRDFNDLPELINFELNVTFIIDQIEVVLAMTGDVDLTYSSSDRGDYETQATAPEVLDVGLHELVAKIFIDGDEVETDALEDNRVLTKIIKIHFIDDIIDKVNF